MSNRYVQLMKKQKEESHEMVSKYMFAAFNQTQLEEGLKKFGIDPNDAKKEIASVGAGLFMPKKYSHIYFENAKKWERELQDAIDADEYGTEFVFDMFNYELSDHEYCITHDPTRALECLGLTYDEVMNDPKLKCGFRRAEKLNRYECFCNECIYSFSVPDRK